MNLQCFILTEQDDTSVLKSLDPLLPEACLPIVNKPLLSRIRECLIHEIPECELLLVVTEKHKKALEETVSSFDCNTVGIKPSFRFVVVESIARGLVDVIPHLLPYITAPNILFLTGDIYGSLPLKALYDLHIAKRTMSSHILSIILLKHKEDVTGKKGSKENKEGLNDRLAVVRQASHILALKSTADIQDGTDVLKLPLANITGRGNNIVVEHCFSDIHCYLMDSAFLSVIAMLTTQYELSSFELDVIPLLVSIQRNLPPVALPSLNVFLLPLVTATSNAIIPTRIQTIQQYLSMNIAQVSAALNSSRDKQKGQCITDLSTTIEAPVVVKKSCVGRKCMIRKGCRITSSVVLDNVIVEEGTKLCNCVICSGAHIEKGCELVNCIVEPGVTIRTGSYTNQTFCSENNCFVI